MTTNEILQLDCRTKENREIIQKVLKQIKPLSKYSDECVPFEGIEKAITVMSKKYNVRIGTVTPDVWSNEQNTIWRATIIDDTNLGTICTIYGLSLYELFAKVAISMYAQVRKGATKRTEDN